MPRATANRTASQRATARATADAELASVLRIGVMRLARRMRQQRAESGLTLTQLSALSMLNRHGPSTPGELAAHEKVQPPSMTRVLAHLARLGLVERAPHPTDGRQVLVALTAGARAVLTEDRRRREAWLFDHLADLSDAERDALRVAAPVLDRLAGAR